jgi:oxygen-independent coproporphyrinogen-3 oxidase
VNALLRELGLYGKVLRDLSLSVVEMHIGGGTPSLVPPGFYKKFLESLSDFFTVKCGVGIEVNPEDFRDYRIVEEFYSSGIDEVSIGVQSFDKRILKSLSRKHTHEDSVLAVENSVKAEFKWINVDLMFLTPSIKGYVELNLEEKLKAFRRDLEKSMDLGVHQITYYATIIPKNSPGHRLVDLGKLHQEVSAIDYFIEEALRFAEEQKLHLTRVYSISRKLYEYATVNLEMIGPLIGLGASAWSNTGFYQYINVHDVTTYTKLLSENKLPALYARRLSKSSRAWRLFFDQLSAVILRDEVFKSFRIEIPIGLKILLKLMELSGLVEKTNEGYKLTKRGILEVYKAVINYVIDIPIKLTDILTRDSVSHLR